MTTTGSISAGRRTIHRLQIAAFGLLVLFISACGVNTDDQGGGLTPITGDTDTVEAVDDADNPNLGSDPDTTAGTDVAAATMVVTADSEQAADDDAKGTAAPTSSIAASNTESTTASEPPTRTFPDCGDGCNYVMEGDSITFNLGQWLWPKFCAEVSAATCVNSGISGNRIDQMIETARNDVDVHLGTGGNDVLIFWGGTNDLWQKFHSPDPAEGARGAYQSTIAYIDERRAKGWDYVVILTHPPMNDEAAAGWRELNELIRDNAAGADTVIDVAVDPKLANPFDPVMKAPDGVHYQDPGRQVVVEEYLIPAIRQLSNR